MTSEPAVWKPSAAEPSKKIGGPNEVTALSLKSGKGASTVSLYDASDSSGAILANLKWVLDAATTGNDNQSFPSPIIFRKGIFAVCEIGLDFDPILCVAVRKYSGS